jgi:hypothetical protein
LFFQVWFQNRRAKWRKSERFQQNPNDEEANSPEHNETLDIEDDDEIEAVDGNDVIEKPDGNMVKKERPEENDDKNIILYSDNSNQNVFSTNQEVTRDNGPTLRMQETKDGINIEQAQPHQLINQSKDNLYKPYIASDETVENNTKAEDKCTQERSYTASPIIEIENDFKPNVNEEIGSQSPVAMSPKVADTPRSSSASELPSGKTFANNNNNNEHLFQNMLNSQLNRESLLAGIPFYAQRPLAAGFMTGSSASGSNLYSQLLELHKNIRCGHPLAGSTYGL